MFTNKTNEGNNDYKSNADRIQRPGKMETINAFFLRANRTLLTLWKKVATEKIPNQIPHSPKLSPQKQNATSRSGHSTLVLANGVHVLHVPI